MTNKATDLQEEFGKFLDTVVPSLNGKTVNDGFFIKEHFVGKIMSREKNKFKSMRLLVKKECVAMTANGEEKVKFEYVLDDVHEKFFDWIQANYLPKTEAVSKSEVEKLMRELSMNIIRMQTDETQDDLYTLEIYNRVLEHVWKTDNLLTKDSNNQVK